MPCGAGTGDGWPLSIGTDRRLRSSAPPLPRSPLLAVDSPSSSQSRTSASDCYHCCFAGSVVAPGSPAGRRRPSPAGDEAARGGAKGETYHAEAAGAGAACEGALSIALASGMPQALEIAMLSERATRPTTRLPSIQGEANQAEPRARSHQRQRSPSGEVRPRAALSAVGACL